MVAGLEGELIRSDQRWAGMEVPQELTFYFNQVEGDEPIPFLKAVLDETGIQVESLLEGFEGQSAEIDFRSGWPEQLILGVARTAVGSLEVVFSGNVYQVRFPEAAGKVSRRHCQVMVLPMEASGEGSGEDVERGFGLLLRDLDSVRGTFLVRKVV